MGIGIVQGVNAPQQLHRAIKFLRRRIRFNGSCNAFTDRSADERMQQQVPFADAEAAADVREIQCSDTTQAKPELRSGVPEQLPDQPASYIAMSYPHSPYEASTVSRGQTRKRHKAASS